MLLGNRGAESAVVPTIGASSGNRRIKDQKDQMKGMRAAQGSEALAVF